MISGSFLAGAMFASGSGGAFQFAIEKATTEGKITIGLLAIVSLFSWTVIITKARQLWRASRMTKKFFKAYRSTRDPLDLAKQGTEFDGAPAYEVYAAAAEEVQYHLKSNPVTVRGQHRIAASSFDSVRVAMERAASDQALVLEKGMIVLSTAVAGGPFLGLLGTVWGVMETFAGIAKASAATLTAMAPGVAGALIATVIGLLVAIPAMFAYNFMVTTVRALTQEMDAFGAEYATSIEHNYVDNRPLADEIADALKSSRQAGAPRHAVAAVEPVGATV
jgi:biopolymer transport protein ExbB/TolQ